MGFDIKAKAQSKNEPGLDSLSGMGILFHVIFYSNQLFFVSIDLRQV